MGSHGDITAKLSAARLPNEQLAAWQALPLNALAPYELVAATTRALSGFAAMHVSGDHALVLCTKLAAIEAVLGRTSQEVAAACAPLVFEQLEVATDVIASVALSRLLQPGRWQLGTPEDTVLCEALRQPLFILLRCVGPDRFTARELLGLARGDLALAVSTAVAGMTGPGVPGVWQVRLWQVLYHLSTPASLIEQVGLGDASGRVQSSNRPMEEIAGMQVSQALRLALCLAQFDAIAAACACASDPDHRGAILVSCMRTLHNLTASPYLQDAGRVLARTLVVHWPRFGPRLLAPHLRRLLTTAEARGKASTQAERELRRDLRTLGWLLHHAPELATQAGPLCAELAMKASKGSHSPETLAVAVGAAANAGLLKGACPLTTALAAVDPKRKAMVCVQFPKETNRLWVVEDAWDIVEDLGFWPKSEASAPSQPAPPLPLGQEDRALYEAFASDLLLPWSNPHMQDGPMAYRLLDPACDTCEPYDGWDEDDGDWYEWQDFESAPGAEYELQEMQTYQGRGIDASGPLGLLQVPAPLPPPAEAPHSPALSLICLAPEAIRCAIDGRICLEPVRTPGGILYNRPSIAAWLSWSRQCPLTGQALSMADMSDDFAVASAVSELRAS
mmetsp:Transcript_69282/g.129380  ORF Transcript_69282/g.129380 Transcript_69282/m.129380 type:complete len:620 (-) Transcript_69282:51-1910(-)